MFQFHPAQCFWINEPKRYELHEDRITLTTEPGTDMWQRTYYGFCNDNAPALLLKTAEPSFSFTVKTAFDSKARFDQCGVILYQNSETWFKASIEYEDAQTQRLGSVVTNHGYSDWATTDISAQVKTMYYRLSRRGSDFCVECSMDNLTFKQMRIFHLWNAADTIAFGLYACSPTTGSFTAEFSQIAITPCQWEKHETP